MGSASLTSECSFDSIVARSENMSETSSSSVKRNVYLMHGFIGSGKTTFAKKLATEKRAMRLTHDDYMLLLYGSNPPANLFRDYAERVSEMLWRMTAELVSLEVPVILDHGFWTKQLRVEAIERVRAMGAIPVIYAIACSPATMKERCLKRTAQGGETLFIDEPAFDSFLRTFEPISGDEEHIVITAD